MASFIHDRKDFKELIAALGTNLIIEPQLIEKDYWIMHALWGLKDLGYNYELKGGTSLSKGWGCIDRFSEDIDILIHPPVGSDVPTGKNQDKLRHIQARKAYFDNLTVDISIPGFLRTESDTVIEDTSGEMRNAGIRLIYPNLFGKIEGLKDGILLEVGFDQTSPNEKIMISSWILDKAIEVKLDITINQAADVKCYVPEYTFVEKLQTVSTKYRKQQANGEMPINFLRHYYDIFQLLKLDRVQNFIGTKKYFEHKEKRFRSGDNKDLTQNDAFIIADDKTKELFEQSFKKTKGLYYKGQPTFKEILESFKPFLEKL